ncbi:hypothetical protein K8I28_15850 [bacterium]|nr:hypothetical protein [bacterium]
MNNKVPNDKSSIPYFRREKNHRIPSMEVSDNAGVESAEHKWCTMECEHAAFPKDNIDGSKSCRTFSALFCNELNEHVTKNTLCAVLHGQRRPKPNW